MQDIGARLNEQTELTKQFWAKSESIAPAIAYFPHNVHTIFDEKDEVLGTLEVYVDPRPSDGVLSVNLAFVGVRPEARKKGQGRKLISYVLQAADALSLPVYLEIEPKKMRGDTRPPMSAEQLHDFYESMGFHEVEDMGFEYMERPARVSKNNPFRPKMFR